MEINQVKPGEMITILWEDGDWITGKFVGMTDKRDPEGLIVSQSVLLSDTDWFTEEDGYTENHDRDITIYLTDALHYTVEKVTQ